MADGIATANPRGIKRLKRELEGRVLITSIMKMCARKGNVFRNEERTNHRLHLSFSDAAVSKVSVELREA